MCVCVCLGGGEGEEIAKKRRKLKGIRKKPFEKGKKGNCNLNIMCIYVCVNFVCVDCVCSVCLCILHFVLSICPDLKTPSSCSWSVLFVVLVNKPATAATQTFNINIIVHYQIK